MITITSFFTNNGIPQEGLVPTITCRRVDTNALVIDAEDMSEIGDGFYKYDFNEDETKDYVFVCDGGNALTDAERYTYASSEMIPMQINLEFCKNIDSGKWEIVNKQMIYYDKDNNEIARFNLYDYNGTPSNIAVFKKVPV